MIGMCGILLMEVVKYRKFVFIIFFVLGVVVFSYFFIVIWFVIVWFLKMEVSGFVMFVGGIIVFLNFLVNLLVYCWRMKEI